MAHLHTAFEDSDRHHQPIIHRDLKSPNLLLRAPCVWSSPRSRLAQRLSEKPLRSR
jgi:serine/threonine protein kinase